MASIRFEEQAEPDTPPSGKATLYVDSVDGEIALKNDAGIVKKFIAAGSEFPDASFNIFNNADNTKILGLDLSGLTTGTTRTWTVPDADGEVVLNTTLSALTFSSDETIVSGTALPPIPHGLPTTPTLIIPQLVCLAPSQGFSIGDVIQIGFDIETTTNRGISVHADATNLNLVFGSSAQVFSILHKTTGVRTTVNNSDWDLRIIAKSI